MSRPFFFNEVASTLRVFGSVILEQDFNMASGVISRFGLRLPVVQHGAPCGVPATARRAVATNSGFAR